MKRVFVTDGIAPATPAIMESLSMSGCHVFVGESFKYNAAFFSKHYLRSFIYPDQATDPEGFADSLTAFLKKEGIQYLIPVRSSTIEAVLKHKDKFTSAGIKTLLPDYPDWIAGEYKHLTIQAALQNGVPVPATIFESSYSYREIVSSLSGPFMLKVSKSSGARGVFRISNEVQFHRICAQLRKAKADFFYQELIAPGGRSCNASYLFNQRGEIKAWFLMEKIRQHPIEGGSTSYARSIKDKGLLSCGCKLLEALHWKGVAEIEFMQDPQDGKFKLLEINPRFWNPVLLAIKAGVDFPKLMVQAMNNEELECVFDYKQDIGFTFFPYELINLIKGKNLGVIKNIFRPNNIYDNFLKLSDPGLFWGMVVQVVYLAITGNSVIKRKIG